jgi:hypothetical protein
VELAADGTVRLFAGYGTLADVMVMSHIAPALTLAGGPITGAFANLGYPCWVASNHGTNVATNQIMFRIYDRHLYLL